MSGAIGKLRVVIADDERPARSFLASVLRKFDDVEIVGEAANGIEAVALIESLQPDLALLDLQMPELDGMGVVQMLPKNRTPLVAFVTAYDEHAVRAFELNAVDYILKPVEAARLRQTITRVQERLERDDYHAGRNRSRPSGRRGIRGGGRQALAPDSCSAARRNCFGARQSAGLDCRGRRVASFADNGQREPHDLLSTSRPSCSPGAGKVRSPGPRNRR